MLSTAILTVRQTPQKNERSELRNKWLKCQHSVARICQFPIVSGCLLFDPTRLFEINYTKS